MGELFKRTNLMGFILKITGLVVIGWGVITGIVILTDYNAEYGYVPLLALTTFFTPIVIGFLFIGFGELIDLVQKILTGNNPTASELINEGTEEAQGLLPPTIPFYAEKELKAHYAKQEEEVDKITPTNERDIFKVDVNERTEYVEVGGFSPKVLTQEEAARFSA